MHFFHRRVILTRRPAAHCSQKYVRLRRADIRWGLLRAEFQTTLHEVFDNCRIGNGGKVSQACNIACRDFLKDYFEYLTAGGSRQSVDPLNNIYFREVSDCVTHQIDKFAFEFVRFLRTVSKMHESVHTATFYGMGIADQRCLSDLVMPNEDRFQLRYSQTMTRGIDHIVDAADYPVLAVFIL